MSNAIFQPTIDFVTATSMLNLLLSITNKEYDDIKNLAIRYTSADLLRLAIGHADNAQLQGYLNHETYVDELGSSYSCLVGAFYATRFESKRWGVLPGITEAQTAAIWSGKVFEFVRQHENIVCTVPIT